MIINIEVDADILIQRLMKRALNSDRADDNEETIKNRIKVFYEKTV